MLSILIETNLHIQTRRLLGACLTQPELIYLSWYLPNSSNFLTNFSPPRQSALCSADHSLNSFAIASVVHSYWNQLACTDKTLRSNDKTPATSADAPRSIQLTSPVGYVGIILWRRRNSILEANWHSRRRSIDTSIGRSYRLTPHTPHWTGGRLIG